MERRISEEAPWGVMGTWVHGYQRWYENRMWARYPDYEHRQATECEIRHHPGNTSYASHAAQHSRRGLMDEAIWLVTGLGA